MTSASTNSFGRERLLFFIIALLRKIVPSWTTNLSFVGLARGAHLLHLPLGVIELRAGDAQSLEQLPRGLFRRWIMHRVDGCKLFIVRRCVFLCRRHGRRTTPCERVSMHRRALPPM